MQGTTARRGSCLGSSLLSALGKDRLIVGADRLRHAAAAAAPYDLRYIYLSGGLFTSSTPCTSCGPPAGAPGGVATTRPPACTRPYFITVGAAGATPAADPDVHVLRDPADGAGHDQRLPGGDGRGHRGGDERRDHDALLQRLALPPADDRHDEGPAPHRARLLGLRPAGRRPDDARGGGQARPTRPTAARSPPPSPAWASA